MIENPKQKSESPKKQVETPQSLFDRLREKRRAIILGVALSMGVSLTGNISKSESADYFSDISPITKKLDDLKYLNIMLAGLDKEMQKMIRNTGAGDIAKISQLSTNIKTVKDRLKEIEDYQRTEARSERKADSSKEISETWKDITDHLQRIFKQPGEFSEDKIQKLIRIYKTDYLFTEYLNSDVNQLNTWIQIVRTYNMFCALKDKKTNDYLDKYNFSRFNSLDEILNSLKGLGVYPKAKAQQKLRWYNNWGEKMERTNIWTGEGVGPDKMKIDTSNFAQHLREDADKKVDQTYQKAEGYNEKKDQAIMVQFLLDQYDVSKGNWHRVMSSSVDDFLKGNVKDTEGFLVFGKNGEEFETLRSKLRQAGAISGINQSVEDFIYDHIDQLN